MATVMKASEFIEKLKDVVENHKTLYVMGCFGAPLTTANKKRYIEHHTYNQQVSRVKHINTATADTFGFDCVCLIKGILWGWNGNKKKAYGGATYNTKGVPDISANQMINVCSDISTDFEHIEPGEAVWTTGHIGVYIGDGLAIECTPAWDNKVQITACNCTKSGYHTRVWKKHGKLPYIDYDVVKKPVTSTKPSTKVDPAQKFDNALTGSYKVNAPVGLHIRTGAGTNSTSLGVLKGGVIVKNYGYYSIAPNGAKWLYVKTESGTEGFCSLRYLKKC